MPASLWPGTEHATGNSPATSGVKVRVLVLPGPAATWTASGADPCALPCAELTPASTALTPLARIPKTLKSCSRRPSLFQLDGDWPSYDPLHLNRDVGHFSRHHRLGGSPCGSASAKHDHPDETTNNHRHRSTDCQLPVPCHSSTFQRSPSGREGCPSHSTAIGHSATTVRAATMPASFCPASVQIRG